MKLTKKNDAKLVVENLAKIIPELSGENMSVQQWFNNFELNAEAYGLNDKQKYVHPSFSGVYRSVRVSCVTNL